MKIAIEQINCIVSNKLKHLIIEKTSGLNNVFDSIEYCKVIAEHKKDDKKKNQVIEITLTVPQDTLFAKDHAETFEIALEMVVMELQQQLKKYKAKISKTNEYAKAWQKVEENSIDYF
jgi:ribosomal subunit interface protein